MQNTRRSPITTTAFLDLTIGRHAVLDSHFDTIINLSQEWTLSKTKVPRASARLQRDDIQRARRTSDSHTVPLQSSGDDGWAVHLFRICRRKDTCSCHSCGGFGLLSQLCRSFLDLVTRRQGRSSARPEQDASNGFRPIRPRAAQLRWLQGRMRPRRKLAFEGKAERVWWDGVC